MSTASIRRERFLPYAYDRGALVLEVSGCSRDGEPVVVGESHTIELIGPWRHAELTLRATVPPEVAARLVPGSEHGDPPLAVLVALRCEPTRLRRGQILDVVGAQATGVLRLRRDELSGSADLHAWLVRTRPHARRAPGFASSAGARVAHAAAWTIALERDRAAATRGLDVQFKSFAADPSIPPTERDNLYRLDCAQDDPVLWLNLDHGPIAEVLRAEGTRGQRARQRDVAFDRIVAAVRLQLVLRAAAHAVADSPVYAWERPVLDDILPRLYPQAQPGDRLARLRAELADPAELVARLDDVLQATEQTARAFTALLEES